VAPLPKESLARRGPKGSFLASFYHPELRPLQLVGCSLLVLLEASARARKMPATTLQCYGYGDPLAGPMAIPGDFPTGRVAWLVILERAPLGIHFAVMVDVVFGLCFVGTTCLFLGGLLTPKRSSLSRPHSSLFHLLVDRGAAPLTWAAVPHPASWARAERGSIARFASADLPGECCHHLTVRWRVLSLCITLSCRVRRLQPSHIV
jgi:hypothetical protein